MSANPEFDNSRPFKDPWLKDLLQVIHNQEQTKEPPPQASHSQAASTVQQLAQEQLPPQYRVSSRPAFTNAKDLAAHANGASFYSGYTDSRDRLQMMRDWQSLSFLSTKAVHCTGTLDNYFVTKMQLEKTLIVLERLDGDTRPYERDCYRYLVKNYERLAKGVAPDGSIVISMSQLPERVERLRHNLIVDMVTTIKPPIGKFTNDSRSVIAEVLPVHAVWHNPEMINGLNERLRREMWPLRLAAKINEPQSNDTAGGQLDLVDQHGFVLDSIALKAA